ncbi:PilW family protein [Haloimpatiens lingqiaonensis]|uniref:PilW family protein n=1 Tax=Haloimpatiens lingqiaonensis TaxID=1380675 RepID=UPI0010FE19A5|nr:prepilin-type N-terminal cleavage/methylation domain-containing protein [Haloimpatiens lingqiaonensis]
MNKKGFTLVETLITTAIFLIVLSILYTFFNANYKNYSSTEAEINLQEEGDRAIEKITEKAMQCSKILQVVDENDVTVYDHNDGIGEIEKKDIISIKSIKIDNVFEESKYYKFYLKENKLYMSTDDTHTGILIAEGIEKLLIKPAGNEGYFQGNKGMYVKLQLSTGRKNGLKKVVETEIYFRN